MPRLAALSALLTTLACCWGAAPPVSGPAAPAVSGAAGAASGEVGPKVGTNLPGSFQPYNVNAAKGAPAEEPDGGAAPKAGAREPRYSSEGKFHSLVTEYDLDPVVMLVAYGLEESAGLRDLLTKLDALLDRHRLARLRCFVVFLAEGVEDVVDDVGPREEEVKKLKKLVEDAKLRNVVVALAGKNDLAKYRAGAAPGLTAILYRQLRVEAVHRVEKDKLEEAGGAGAKAILDDVKPKLIDARR
jgi:hypothetical protein